MNIMGIAIGLIALVVFLAVIRSVRIVPQSHKYVVERLGRLHAVLGPGVNFTVPFIDRVAHNVSILERQLPNAKQDVITKDNVLVNVEMSVFYRITEPEKTVYRIQKVDAAISTTVAGIVRAEIGQMLLDDVQSNRSDMTAKIKAAVADAVDDWGIEVTRAEVLDVNLDEATRRAMLQQVNAERARRAAVLQAEGQKEAAERAADAELYTAEKRAEAVRIQAEAEAHANEVLARSLSGEQGDRIASYQVSMKQIEALAQIAAGDGRQTVVLPASALDAFTAASAIFKGKAA